MTSWQKKYDAQAKHRLDRETFRTSRLLDFATERELTKQVGHPPAEWPLVIGKELFDNALDACEEAGKELIINAEVPSDYSRITIIDNGPGIAGETVRGLLDFTARMSSRSAYCSPTRGAQGNALSAIVCMPFALSGGKQGLVEIAALGVRHHISFGVDMIRQEPRIDYRAEPDARENGTEITIHWPDSASSILAEAEPRFLQIAQSFGLINPTLSCTVSYGDQQLCVAAAADSWAKWLPSDPTSPHWYDLDRFKRLISACITADADSGTGRTVREFISTFRGLSSTGRQKAILDQTGLARAPLTALIDDGAIDAVQAAGLLTAMRGGSAAVKPALLGVIGRDNIAAGFEAAGVIMDSFAYYKAEGTPERPYILEAAFGWTGDPPIFYEQDYDEENGHGRRLIIGINWSPALNPLRAIGGHAAGLADLLGDLWMSHAQPVMLLLHLTMPAVQYLDHGKSAVHFPDGEVIETAIRTVAKKWAKQCSSEYRSASAALNRRARLTGARERKPSAIEAVEMALPEAWALASGDGALPASARQIYYAIREPIAQLTGKPLNYQYFSQQLLPGYIESHEAAAGWDVTYDARGEFSEPHTGHRVPLGTIDVREYLESLANPEAHDAMRPQLDTRYPTNGPGNRFGALLFNEKAGFDPVLEAAQIAERFDIATMSTKGMSVTAARRLAEEICAGHDIPLLILHDFDISGMTIAGTLREDTRRYQFTRNFRVIDFGLRLADLPRDRRQRERMSEQVHFDAKIDMAAKAATLRKYGASEAEIDYLTEERRRVELNAFTSPAFVAFVERKLRQHGIGKIVPDAGTLAKAARRLLTIQKMQEAIDAIADRAEVMPMPAKLEERLRSFLARHPHMPWDDAMVALLARPKGKGRDSAS